jgi:Family of unknown function (DUF5681)
MRGGKRSTSFKPGQTGNPGGRPKMTEEQKREIADVRMAARAMTMEALEALKEVVGDKAAPPSARVSAATTILDRGWGKATQTIEATVTNRIDVMGIDELRAFVAREIEDLGAGSLALEDLRVSEEMRGLAN